MNPKPLTSEQLIMYDVAIQLVDKENNRQILKDFTEWVKYYFKNYSVIVGIGDQQKIKLRSMGYKTEASIITKVRDLGGTFYGKG